MGLRMTYVTGLNIEIVCRRYRTRRRRRSKALMWTMKAIRCCKACMATGHPVLNDRCHRDTSIGCRRLGIGLTRDS